MTGSPAAERVEPARVFVSVGSDHHRFQRLVNWVDSWARDRGIDCLIQYGSAVGPRYARGSAFLSHDDVLTCMRSADLVVVQGGPMSIIEARDSGRLPIVVPRLARRSEVVDDHQVAFSRQLAAEGLLRLAESEEELRAALDAGLADPRSHALAPSEDPARHESAVTAAMQLQDALLGAASAKSPARPRVIYLAGYGRSGSTLLERLIAAGSDAHALGEVLYLWKVGLPADERCGCGALLAECPFWQSVGQRAVGGWGRLNVQEVARARERVVRFKYIPGLVAGVGTTSHRLNRNRLARVATALYSAAAEVAGTAALIDSSKHPAYVYLLRRVRIDLRCVLVVRDPRGVAFSWRKVMERPEVVAGTALMPRYGVAVSSLRWVGYNASVLALRRLGVPVLVVHYEDLTVKPQAIVNAVADFAGIPSHHLQMHSEGVVLPRTHSVAGNPMRFSDGPVRLAVDDEWRQSMTRRDQLVVSSLTWPMRRLFRYVS